MPNRLALLDFGNGEPRMRSVVIAILTCSALYLLFVGVASIANSRLLEESAVPIRYAKVVNASDDGAHVHNVHIQRRFFWMELNGYSDEPSYVRLATIRLPIFRQEWFGWMLLAMAGVTITVCVLSGARRRHHP